MGFVFKSLSSCMGTILMYWCNHPTKLRCKIKCFLLFDLVVSKGFFFPTFQRILRSLYSVVMYTSIFINTKKVYINILFCWLGTVVVMFNKRTKATYLIYMHHLYFSVLFNNNKLLNRITEIDSVISVLNG